MQKDWPQYKKPGANKTVVFKILYEMQELKRITNTYYKSEVVPENIISVQHDPSRSFCKDRIPELHSHVYTAYKELEIKPESCSGTTAISL
jgi:hypothetical protein